MSDTPKADRVETAATGIEEDVVSLTERLRQKGDGDPIEHDLRLLEALLFAASEPIDTETLRDRMPEETDVGSLLARLSRDYAGRGINLVSVANKWRFQTASDLAGHLVDIKEAPRKLSRAALETLAIIAYHQPVTRAEIEDVRLLDPRLPKDFEMPTPMEMDDLRIDEDPLVDEEQPEFFEDFMGDEQDG